MCEYFFYEFENTVVLMDCGCLGVQVDCAAAEEKKKGTHLVWLK